LSEPDALEPFDELSDPEEFIEPELIDPEEFSEPEFSAPEFSEPELSEPELSSVVEERRPGAPIEPLALPPTAAHSLVVLHVPVT
jgi:hypothetical protein